MQGVERTISGEKSAGDVSKATNMKAEKSGREAGGRVEGGQEKGEEEDVLTRYKKLPCLSFWGIPLSL